MSSSASDSIFLETYFPSAYQDLKRLAYSQLRGERADHTFHPTDLVHEVYLKLAAQDKQSFGNKGHFFSVASQAMRRILVSYAREKQSQKRGGDQLVMTLEAEQVAHQTTYDDLIHLHETLAHYQQLSQRGVQIIELWFFGGFKHEEIATMLEISTATVRREWRLARVWLSQQMKSSE